MSTLQSFWRKIHPQKPLRNLTWIDILALTLILFGQAIWTSTTSLIYNLTVTATATDATAGVEFSDMDNWWALLNQGQLLLLALAYLLLRHFDFSQFKDKIRLSWSLIPWILIIHILSSFAMDLQYYNVGIFQISWTLDHVLSYLSVSSISLVLYSLLNGFYEEFYFLGLLLSTDKKYRIPILIFSTLVRMSFHTYVNIPFAISIGLIFGLVYNYLYLKKYNNLLAYFLAHALCDIYGIGVLYLFIAYS